MLKYALLAGAMMISTPALAQTAATPTAPVPATDATPAQTAPVPAQDAAVAPAQPAMATETLPASQPQVAQTAPADPATAPTEVAAAPQDKSEQVAAVVNSEFAGYDKDGNGSLSNAEFGAWMVALKSASDPATKADAPATKKWVGAAFASADKDKSKSVTKEELTGFLAQG